MHESHPREAHRAEARPARSGHPLIQALGRLAWPGGRHGRVGRLADELLRARAQEAALWHEADPGHRAGILGSLSRTYQAIAGACDPASAAAGRMTGVHPYDELARLARLLSDSERRQFDGPDAFPLTWHQIPSYIQALDGAESGAWTRFWLSTDRTERTGLLCTTLAAAAAGRAGEQVAAFLATAGWSGLAAATPAT